MLHRPSPGSFACGRTGCVLVDIEQRRQPVTNSRPTSAGPRYSSAVTSALPASATTRRCHPVGPRGDGRGLHRTVFKHGLLVAGLAAVSALLTALLSHTVFSHLSVNNDESVYLLQARALAAGHLFPSAPEPAASFTP